MSARLEGDDSSARIFSRPCWMGSACPPANRGKFPLFGVNRRLESTSAIGDENIHRLLISAASLVLSQGIRHIREFNPRSTSRCLRNRPLPVIQLGKLNDKRKVQSDSVRFRGEASLNDILAGIFRDTRAIVLDVEAVLEVPNTRTVTSLPPCSTLFRNRFRSRCPTCTRSAQIDCSVSTLISALSICTVTSC